MRIGYWISAAVVVAVIGLGGGLAVTMRSTEPAHSRPDAPIAETSPDSDDALRDFPHRSLRLRDEVEPGSEFDQFRQRLRQAVQARDAEFVAALIPESGVSLGFGAPRTRDELELENPDALLWSILEKAMALGCDRTSADYPAPEATQVWVCHNINQLFYEQYPPPPSAQGVEYELSQVIVVGEDVNVRAQPTTSSPIVGILSNEVVTFDRQTWEIMPAEQRSPDSIDGWTPVVLLNERSGYVFDRYVYFPLGYRVLFGQVDGQWQILHVPGGD
jgi:hypothetical protein